MIKTFPLLPLTVQDAAELMGLCNKHGEETSVQTLQNTEDPGTGEENQATVSLKA